MKDIVNMSSMTRRADAVKFAAALESVLGTVAWLKGSRLSFPADPVAEGCDIQLRIPIRGGGHAALCVVCRKVLHPGAFEPLTRRSFRSSRRADTIVPVLALPWVSPRLADLCAEHGWSWIDLAGNHLLDVPGVLRIERRGLPPGRTHSRPAANIGTPEAGRIIRALLTPEHAARRWTQRDVQDECVPRVSIGLVNKVVRHLLDEAYLVREAAGGFRLHDPRRLLEAWCAVYRFHMHERHGYHTLLKAAALQKALAAFGQRGSGGAAFASFSAAEIQAPHVRQPRTWVYARAQDLTLLESCTEAQAVESGENLVVLLPADDGVFAYTRAGSASAGELPCTNPVQTYVDLFHSGGRGVEAAEALLEQHLIPAWRKAGLKT